MAALYAPIGLFLGRLANFVNDELWGRVSEVPWAVRFPSGGYLPRHPSQLYEAFCEGLLMLLILNCLWRFCPVVRKRKGTVSALFVVLYAVFRIVLENFRQPDAQLGFYFGFVTMGQMLSFCKILRARMKTSKMSASLRFLSATLQETVSFSAFLRPLKRNSEAATVRRMLSTRANDAPFSAAGKITMNSSAPQR